MELIDAIRNRHSVRSFQPRAIEPEVESRLRELINDCNDKGLLHIQLITDDPQAFGRSLLAHYGKFSGVRNYLAMVGPDDEELDERVGYYGEQIVLEAQRLGLNSCWVGLTFKKNKQRIVIDEGEKLACVIALGYGTTQGVPHKSKPMEKVASAEGIDAPSWFVRGVEAALLAPTAVNQQKFHFRLVDNNRVRATTGFGFFNKIDLGIAKFHFEVGAHRENFDWEK